MFQSNITVIEKEESNFEPFIKYVPSTQIPHLSISNDTNFLSNNGSIENFNTLLKSSKIENFPPEININDYFFHLFRQEINIPESKTKEEFISFNLLNKNLAAYKRLAK